MAQTKRDHYDRQREKIEELATAWEAARDGRPPHTNDWPFLEPADADAILAWADAYDDEKATATPNGNGDGDRWGDSRAPTTLRQWTNAVSSFAREVDGSLLEAATDDLNRAAERMLNGRAAVLSEKKQANGGLSKNTVRTRQNSLKKFLQHVGDDARGDPEGLHIYDSGSSLVDPADMLSEEEFHAFRNAPEHPRDRAIVNLFLYTGQRNHAIRTMRVKDVDLEDGTYRLNPTVDGLKGADRVATWNSLLGAKNAVQDWLGHHPAPDDGDAYLLTERRDNVTRDPYSTISDDTVNRALRTAAEVAAKEYPDIERKPTNAHAMRHNFVTMCKVRYDMDNDTIKRLIRHKPDSTVMETTYAHLSDEDYIEKAERAFGMHDESEEEFSASPEVCDTCNEPLAPSAKACPNCGTVYSPDAETSKQKALETAEEQKQQADTLEEYRGADALEELIEKRVQERVDEKLDGILGE